MQKNSLNSQTQRLSKSAGLLNYFFETLNTSGTEPQKAHHSQLYLFHTHFSSHYSEINDKLVVRHEHIPGTVIILHLNIYCIDY